MALRTSSNRCGGARDSSRVRTASVAWLKQLPAQVRGQIDADAGFDRKLGIVFRLRHDDCKAVGGNPRAGIADDAAADAG